jgi:hypothetical protein
MPHVDFKAHETFRQLAETGKYDATKAHQLVVTAAKADVDLMLL